MELSEYNVAYLQELNPGLAGSAARIQCKELDNGCDTALPYPGFGDRTSEVPDASLVDDGGDSFAVANAQSYLIKDASVWTQYGLVTVENTLLRDSTPHFPWHLFPNFKYVGELYHETKCLLPAKPPAVTISNGYSIHPGIQTNYYHWLILGLCRLNSAFLDGWADELDSKPVLLVPDLVTSVHRQSAEVMAAHFKLPMVNVSRPLSTRVKNLIYPLPMRYGGLRPHPMITETFSILKNKFYETGDYPEKLYISRSDTNNRKMANEKAVEAFLEAQGYTIVILTNKTLSEQINLFAHARSIIGPHGAGLTNVVFCDPGASILEIHMPSYFNWCYRRLAAVTGVNYGFITGKLLETSGHEVSERQYEIDIDRLKACLGDAL